MDPWDLLLLKNPLPRPHTSCVVLLHLMQHAGSQVLENGHEGYMCGIKVFIVRGLLKQANFELTLKIFKILETENHQCAIQATSEL